MENPEVSVVMSVYNGAGSLPATLQSVLSQQGCHFEFIVVNDGSSDESGRILGEWAARDARLRVIHQANTGLTRALIRGCSEARGEFIARQDCGDVSLSGRLAAQVASLRAAPISVATSCHTRFIGPANEWLYDQTIDEATLNAGLIGEGGRFHGPSHHGSVMMRSKTYRDVGGYRDAFYFAQDLDLWTRLADMGRFCVVDECLYEAKLEPQSISGTQTAEQNGLAELIGLATVARRVGEPEVDFLQKAANIQPVKRAGLQDRIARGNYFIGSCLAKRDPAAASTYFGRAVALRPAYLKAWFKLIACSVVARVSQRKR